MQSDSEQKNQKIINFMRLLSKMDKEKVKIEGEKFQEDYKNHGSGALLWAKEEYPNYMLFISIFSGSLLDKVTNTFLPGMKKVVDEYFTFHNDVKSRNPDLYQEEMKESNELVFEKTIQPMDVLVVKDPFIKNFNRKFLGGLKTLKPQMQEYSDKLRFELASYGETLKEKSNSLPQKEEFDSILKGFKSNKGSFTKLNDFVASFKQIGEHLKTFQQDIQNISEETGKKIKELQKESLPDLPKITNEFKILTDDFKEIYDVNDPSWAYQRLSLIKDVDSFHIIFTKFIARLNHILSHDNREYAKKKPQIVINPKRYYSNTRSKLKKILKSEMKQKYPKLSEYLLSMFAYNKYRKIEAHDIPKIRMSNGFAYIPVSGTNKEVEMNLEEIKTILNTYSFFIKALNLVSNYTP